MLEVEAFDGFEFPGDVFDRLRQSSRQNIDQEQLDRRQSNDDRDNLLVRLLELADEIVRRRDNDGLPRMSEALREAGERGAQLPSVARRAKQEIVLIRLRLLPISFAHVVIDDILQTRDFHAAGYDLHTLFLLGSRDDRAVCGVCNDGRAVWAASVGRQELRQDIERDIGTRAPDEITIANDGHPDKKDRISGIGIDRRFCDDQSP
jgi:hypothetical protein